MAEPAACKLLVRHQVGKAVVCCDSACGLLAAADGQLDEALGDLRTHAFVDDPRAWRRWAHRAEGMVADASGELDAAAYLMATAGLLALRGGADGKTAPPPPSINDVPDEGLRDALSQLNDARNQAESACDFAGVCRGHLVGVVRLLDHPRPLPGGVKGFVNVKLGSARDNLNDARRCAQESTQVVYGALVSLLI